jgi:murein DD-endopeptidase MepM/ murein hydrolase activator NlpD
MVAFVAPVTPARVVRGWSREHDGLDLAVPVVSPVRAIAAGLVIRVDAVDRWIAIRHEGGWISRYRHLAAVGTSVGARVAAGQVVGQAGPPRLYIELRLPPECLHREYVARFGTPKTGFRPGIGELGIAVPAEPLVPVQAYEPQVLERAKAHGIPLAASQIVLSGPPPGSIDENVESALVPVAILGGLLVAWALR